MTVGVSTVGNRDNAIFLGNQILDRQVMGRIGNLCLRSSTNSSTSSSSSSRILLEPVGVTEDFQIIGNFGNLVGVLLKQLLVLQAVDDAAAIENRLRLRG